MIVLSDPLVFSDDAYFFDAITANREAIRSGPPRAIQPFHTSRDGDTLFAVTTANCDANDPHLADLTLYASELAWDAVLSPVPQPRVPEHTTDK
jgi:hypothetical protein